MDHQQLILYASLPIEIEIAVVREIQDRVLIAHRVITDVQFIFLPAEFHADAQRAGIALLAVRRNAAEAQSVCFLVDLPHVLVKANLAAMQMVRTVVRRERIGLAVQLKHALADAVCEAPDRRADVARVFRIALDRIIAQHHVDELAAAVRRQNAAHRRAVVQNFNAQPVLVFHRPAAHLRAVLQCAEHSFLKFHIGSSPCFYFCAAAGDRTARLQLRF